jgi:hypothetical protein
MQGSKAAKKATGVESYWLKFDNGCKVCKFRKNSKINLAFLSIEFYNQVTSHIDYLTNYILPYQLPVTYNRHIESFWFDLENTTFTGRFRGLNYSNKYQKASLLFEDAAGDMWQFFDKFIVYNYDNLLINATYKIDWVGIAYYQVKYFDTLSLDLFNINRIK